MEIDSQSQLGSFGKKRDDGAPIALCKLCLHQRQLRESHILPELLYKRMYPEQGHRQIKRFSSDPKERGIIFQKGLWEYLLCADCEQFLNENYEKYADTVFFHTTPRREIAPTPTPVPKAKGFEMYSVDYAN